MLAVLDGNARGPSESSLIKSTRRESEVLLAHQELVERRRADTAAAHPSFGHIPQFFRAARPPADGLCESVAKQRLLQAQTQALPSKSELQQLYQILSNCASGALGLGAGPCFDYPSFRKVAQMAPRCFAPYLTARVFCMFEADEDGRVPIGGIYKYVVRQVDMWRCRVALAQADTASCGRLSETQLEDYIHSMIPGIVESGGRPPLREAERCAYIQLAVCKFFFMHKLDPQQRLSVTDLLGSDVLHEFVQLQAQTGQAEHSNWFSMMNFERVMRMWRGLDMDGDNMIRPDDLARFGSRTYTSLFVTRLFQVHARAGLMGFKGFLELLLACENKNELPALRYFFKVIDLEDKGYWDPDDIHAFVRTMGVMLMDHGHVIGGDDNCNFMNDDGESSRARQLFRHCREVRGEVFDMVGPQDSSRITLDDLHACGVGGTVVSMLTEMRGFWAYENRETPMHQPPEEPEPVLAPTAMSAPSVGGQGGFMSTTTSSAFQSYGDGDESDEIEFDEIDEDELYSFD